MMFRRSLLSRRLAVILAGLILCVRAAASVEDTFKTPQNLATEATWLVKLLEGAHYSRSTVHPGDYGAVIPDYMTALDGQHLFFLDSDRARFTKAYNGDTLYSNIAYLGNIDPAYEIYRIYEKRVQARITWIQEALKKPVDLSTNETYAVDRTKADWPATAADSDELWGRRLKFELVAEMLGKKTPDQAKDTVKKAGVPIVPGSDGPVENEAEAVKIARKIGYPKRTFF